MIFLLSQIIDKSAERFPDKEAFRCDGQGLTYAALVERANRLAAMLIEQGVKPGDRVGIYLPKSLETAVALFGILKAGAAYVPLDPHMPLSRLAFILRDCDIRHLIADNSQRKNLGQLVTLGAELEAVIGLSGSEGLPCRAISWTEVEAMPARSPAAARMEQDMAYLMYTSGSTGEPKGMIHTHHSGLSYAKLAAAVYDLHAGDRLSNFPPLHFDQSTFDYFSGPLVGATTVIIPEVYTRFPANLSQLMAAEKLTIWYSVPFALIQLLLRGVLAERDLTALRWVLFGGEPFPPKHLKALMTLWPQARFSNVYGPAEVNQCTFFHVPPPAEISDEPLPIGRIWPNAEGLVVDENDGQVTEGEVGELLVRTPTMMQGYWRRPDLNTRAFFYREQPGGPRATFYRTGDLVKLRPDGYYDFLGRKDRQVKTRGFRVELDEVEAALLSHPQVEEAAAFPVPDSDGGQLIQAAVIAKAGEPLPVAALLKHLAVHLPRYAIPTRIELRDDFPRTSSGKIDRRALQAQAKEDGQT